MDISTFHFLILVSGQICVCVCVYFYQVSDIFSFLSSFFKMEPVKISYNY